MVKLCAPAFIYLFISLVDVIYNAYLGLYNNLLVKIIVIISVALVLNILCERGFSEISWLIVLLSFSLIVMIMLTSVGCNIYYIPTVNIPTMNMPTMNMPTMNMPPMNMPTMNMPTIISYKHAPTGTSDPQYKS